MIFKQQAFFLVFSCLVFSCLSALAIRDSTGPEAVNFEGTYLLSVPSTPFTLRKNTLTITLCNSYSIRIIRASAGNIIAVDNPLQTTTNPGCEKSNDSLYLALLRSVNSYQVVGTTLYLLSQKKVVASAIRYRSFWPESDRLEGKFELNLPKLPLTATTSDIIFFGCNRNNFSYTATSDNKIAITPSPSVFVPCPVNLDQVYTSALLNARNFIFAPLKFTLYGENGEQAAYGSPPE